eukprot:g863.t1
MDFIKSHDTFILFIGCFIHISIAWTEIVVENVTIRKRRVLVQDEEKKCENEQNSVKPIISRLFMNTSRLPSPALIPEKKIVNENNHLSWKRDTITKLNLSRRHLALCIRSALHTSVVFLTLAFLILYLLSNDEFILTMFLNHGHGNKVISKASIGFFLNYPLFQLYTPPLYLNPSKWRDVLFHYMQQPTGSSMIPSGQAIFSFMSKMVLYPFTSTSSNNHQWFRGGYPSLSHGVQPDVSAQPVSLRFLAIVLVLSLTIYLLYRKFYLQFYKPLVHNYWKHTTKVLEEIVNTEKQYVRDLGNLIHAFAICLPSSEDENERESTLLQLGGVTSGSSSLQNHPWYQETDEQAKEAVKNLARSLPGLHQLHCKLCLSLVVAETIPEFLSNIEKFSPFFRLYSPYTSNYYRALDLLNRMETYVSSLQLKQKGKDKRKRKFQRSFSFLGGGETNNKQRRGLTKKSFSDATAGVGDNNLRYDSNTVYSRYTLSLYDYIGDSIQKHERWNPEGFRRQKKGSKGQTVYKPIFQSIASCQTKVSAIVEEIDFENLLAQGRERMHNIDNTVSFANLPPLLATTTSSFPYGDLSPSEEDQGIQYHRGTNDKQKTKQHRTLVSTLLAPHRQLLHEGAYFTIPIATSEVAIGKVQIRLMNSLARRIKAFQDNLLTIYF